MIKQEEESSTDGGWESGKKSLIGYKGIASMPKVHAQSRQGQDL
jgi:hypothetical protein